MLLSLISLLSLALCWLLTARYNLAPWLTVLSFAGLWLLLLAAAFAFLFLVCAFVDQSKPQETDSPFYRRLANGYIAALITLTGIRLHRKGFDQLPREGRFLLVCNHIHIADPEIILHCFASSQLAFITKQENQKLPLVGPIMHKILCQPLDRDNDRQALKVILTCIRLLKEDKASIAVFPEGYTSKDGKLHPFRSGVFKIAQKAQVPIVVCTIAGDQMVFKNMRRLKPTHVPVHLVKVIPAEQLQGMSTVEIGHLVYETMIADLGEEARYLPE